MKISTLEFGEASISNLSNLNIIMGRNGAGKSRLLRRIERGLYQNSQYHMRYVSPERAGSFERDGNIITSMSMQPTWLSDTRAVNQASNFKAASAVLLREEETLYLRRLANTPEIRNDPDRSFQVDRLDKINSLLSNIALHMGNSDFEFRTLSGDLVAPREISSGEAEAVSLATEILYFFDTVDINKFNVLLLDEPDVHLHPDLQARLGKLILSMLDEFSDHLDKIAICISTHSAPFVCAVSSSDYTSIGTKSFGVDNVVLKKSPEQLRKVGPFFGHPLSLTLSEDAALIVEGEDDERVWQQAARSSKGRIKVFPVLATSVDQQSDLEKFCVDLFGTLYDDPIAFSVRDGDGVKGEKLEHLLPLRRYRLTCYAIENTLVSDECLSVLGTSWEAFKGLADSWIAANDKHRDINQVRDLISSSDRLRHVKIKAIRQLICTIAGSNRPWEVVVGQALGQLTTSSSATDNMLVDFIGEDAIKAVLFRIGI